MRHASAELHLPLRPRQRGLAGAGRLLGGQGAQLLLHALYGRSSSWPRALLWQEGRAVLQLLRLQLGLLLWPQLLLGLRGRRVHHWPLGQEELRCAPESVPGRAHAADCGSSADLHALRVWEP